MTVGRDRSRVEPDAAIPDEGVEAGVVDLEVGVDRGHLRVLGRVERGLAGGGEQRATVVVDRGVAHGDELDRDVVGRLELLHDGGEPLGH